MIPHPIFDTQVAAMVLGYGDSISYDQLVQRITGDTLDKSHRFTDWTRRPLSDAQVTYARLRRHPSARRLSRLAADLEKRGRANWVEAEMGVLTSPETYRADPERAWERLKTRVRKPKDLAVLMEVAAWREREAQTRDVPRSRVLKDDTIGDIAVQAPTTIERLGGSALAAERLRALALGRRHRRGGQARPGARSRRRCRGSSVRPAPNGAATVELLKVLLRMTAERHGVAAKVIATVDDLDRIAADDEADVPALKGWRRELFGEKALALKHGRLALAVEKGRVVTVEKN